MKFLDDIRKQSQATRELMFGLSVFITVLTVGLVWFNSFQRNLYALMNPPEEVDRILALENTPPPSLFSLVSQTAGDVKALVSGLLNNQQPTTNNQQPDSVKVGSERVHALPLSDYK